MKMKDSTRFEKIKSKKGLKRIIWILLMSQKKKWNRTNTWWSPCDKEWKWRTQQDLKELKTFQVKEGLGG